MKKALLLFGVAGCFCAGDAEKLSPARTCSDKVWSGIENGTIKEFTGDCLQGLSTNDQIEALNILHGLISFKALRDQTPTVVGLHTQIKTKLDALKTEIKQSSDSRTALYILAMIVTTWIVAGVLYFCFYDQLKPYINVGPYILIY